MIAYPILEEFKEHQRLKRIIYRYSKKVFKDRYPVCCFRVNTNITVLKGDYLKTEIVLLLPKKECIIWDKKFELKHLRSLDRVERDNEIIALLKKIVDIHIKNAEKDLYRSISYKFGADRYIRRTTGG